MKLKLTQDEQTALKKIGSFHKANGRFFVDINHTGINVTALLCFIVIAALFYGMVSGNVQPAFAGFLLLAFSGVLWQIGFQFRTLAELVKKQNDHIQFLEATQDMPTLSDKAGKLWQARESDSVH